MGVMSDLFPTVVHVATPDWDWQGLYVNGKLRYEGHSIPVHEWLDIVEGTTKEIELVEEVSFPKELPIGITRRSSERADEKF